MENLDTGKDKIKKICEILKNETLQPAQVEGQRIIEAAQQEARQIIRTAEVKAEELLLQAQKAISKEKELFENSVRQGCKQTLESLRQEIEKKFFKDTMGTWVSSQTIDPKLLAGLIKALIEAIQREGTSTELSVLIPKTVSVDQVNALLGQEILKALRDHTVSLGPFGGGVQVKLHDRKMTLDLSNDALKELLGRYIRKDFREMLFQL